MKIGVVGLGYAGLCTAACLAKKFDVIGIDVDRARIARLNAGEVPIREKGLGALVKSGRANGRLAFSNDYKALRGAEFIFLAVGTPSRADGSIDLTQVRSACVLIGQEIAKARNKPQVIIKSTVTPGTARAVTKSILESESGKRCGDGFGLCSNPEFLREGAAIEDSLNPERIVIGSVDDESRLALKSLYNKFYGKRSPPIVETTPENAELIKYASNTFLATKISFMNFIAGICENLPGADVNEVARGMGLDPRIGRLYLQAGPGFGGSCFPKDSQALRSYVEQLSLDGSLLRSVLSINDAQPIRILLAVERALSTLGGKEVAMLGVAFKEGSDDLRESRAVVLAKRLVAKRAKVRVYDPVAMGGARRELGEGVIYASNAKQCIKGADAAIVMTGWDEFRNLRPGDFAKLMRTPNLFDARRIYDPREYSSHVNFMAVGYGPSK